MSNATTSEHNALFHGKYIQQRNPDRNDKEQHNSNLSTNQKNITRKQMKKRHDAGQTKRYKS